MAAFIRNGSHRYDFDIHVLSQMPGLSECLTSFSPSYLEYFNDILSTITLNFYHYSRETNPNFLLDAKSIEAIKKADIVICDTEFLVKHYKKLKNARWVHCTSVGVEDLFEAIPEEPRFRLTRHGGDSAAAMMAEYVMCQILNHERRMQCYWEKQAGRNWRRMGRFDAYRSLADLTVGIMGVGHMGTGVAKFLKSRGASLIGFCRTPRSFLHRVELFSRITTFLDEFLHNCDYIVNTLPSTPATKGLLNNSALQMCLKAPVFINVGSGDIISEDELVLALRNEWISAAVLDVFKTEPLQRSSQLWQMPKVTITPHVAAPPRPDHVAVEFFRLLCLYYLGIDRANCVFWPAGY